MFNLFFSNNLFYKFQSEFTPGHSTLHQLIEIFHNICIVLEEKKNKFVSLVFCDISKAFDRVWLKGLLRKLESYGIQGDLLKWLRSYLVNRKQCVVVKHYYSSVKYLKAGVPQSSVLGPLLFPIYINDIADILESVTRLFADDTSLSYSLYSYQLLETKINN